MPTGPVRLPDIINQTLTTVIVDVIVTIHLATVGEIILQEVEKESESETIPLGEVIADTPHPSILGSVI